MDPLLTDAQFCDNNAITRYIVIHQVVQQPTALSYQLQEATTGRMILRMALQMFCQLNDSRAENGDLDFGLARVLIVSSKLLNQLAFSFARNHGSALNSIMLE